MVGYRRDEMSSICIEIPMRYPEGLLKGGIWRMDEQIYLIYVKSAAVYILTILPSPLLSSPHLFIF